MRGIIVRFTGRRYSFKTEHTCMWCKHRFWNSPSEIRQAFHTIDFHDEVLIAGPTINKRISEIWESR